MAAGALRLLRRPDDGPATAAVLDRLQVTLPDRGPTVGLMSGGQRKPSPLPRAPRSLEGRHPRRADGGLGLRESRQVLDLILRLRDEGRAVIVISHAMDHVTEVADRAVVMRRGRKVGEEIPSPESQQRIVALIVGPR